MDETWTELVRSHEATVELPSVRSVPRKHEPRAAVLTCADARVSPAAIFAQAPGALFTIRIAGNTATLSAIASLDYAVEQLGVALVVVMGHTDCGAVAAAMAGDCEGRTGAITAPICETVRRNPGADATGLSERNVSDTIAAVTHAPGPTGDGIRNGAVDVVGVIHDLARGAIYPVPTDPLPVP